MEGQLAGRKQGLAASSSAGIPPADLSANHPLPLPLTLLRERVQAGVAHQVRHARLLLALAQRPVLAAAVGLGRWRRRRLRAASGGGQRHGRRPLPRLLLWLLLLLEPLVGPRLLCRLLLPL